MNVVFWSPFNGHGATTSNMVCVALMSSLMHCYKTISFQSGYSDNNLDQSLIGKEVVTTVNSVNEEFAYYMEKGIDGIHSSIYMESFQKDKIKNYSVEVIKGLGYFLPSTTKSNEDLFNDRMLTNIYTILSECNKCFDLTFVDNQSKFSKVTKNLLISADVCVININQNLEMIDRAKNEFENMNCSCKVLYVIGRYDDYNKFSVKSIAKKFHINKDDIGVVPYCSDFLEAILLGRTKEFLKANLNCGKRGSNYFFMNEVKNLTEKLLKKVGEKAY